VFSQHLGQWGQINLHRQYNQQQAASGHASVPGKGLR
jgi:hypothetical protein